MENSWQMKCDSSFQPSTPAIASQEPKSQMEMSTGRCLYPRVGHGLVSKFPGVMQEHNCPSFLHPNGHGSCRADSGNSFLALLSGSPSLLQCDFNELSDPKPCSFYGNPPAASGNFFINSVGNGALLTSRGGLITENVSNHDLESRADAFPSFIQMSGLNSGFLSVFHDTQNAKVAAQPTVPDSEKAREPPSRGQFCWTGPASTLKFCRSESQTRPSEEISNKQASPFMSGCPRVFCLGKSGYLLLSNTGLLGIVCSCHCCHMSVLKFCEHSGLRDVNPGDAVCMESGETIAQWRKLYFLKFGIRSPGNDSEWDWPEVLSTTASLMKSNASASNALKIDSSHLCNLSTTVLSRLGKPSDSIMFPQNVPTDHNLFIGLSTKQHASIQDTCYTPLSSFTGISQSNLRDIAVGHVVESNLASLTVTPNFVGTLLDDGCQSIPACVDPLKRNDKLSTSPLLLQNLELSMESNANDGLVHRDAAISNIELRLGQPPHRSGHPVPSVTESHLFDALVTPSKFQLLKETVHNNFQRKEEEFRRNFCYAAGPSNSKIVEEQMPVKLRNYMSRHINDVGTARARLDTDCVDKDSVILPPPHFNPQLDRNAHPNTNEILLNDGGLNLPKIRPSGSTAMQFHPNDALWNGNDILQRQLSTYASNSNKFLENDKGVSCDKNSGFKTDSGFRISELMENLGLITRAGGGSSNGCISTVNGKNHKSYNESSMILDAYVGKSIPCCPERGSSPGQDNHLIWRSFGTQLPSGMTMSSEGILMGLPFPISASSSNQTPNLLQQEGFNMDNHMLDENTRLLALTQILELSKQQQALFLHEVNKKQWRSGNCSEVRNSVHDEASVCKQGTSDPKLLLPQNTETFWNHCGSTGDVGKLASFTEGLNNYCHLPTLASMCLHPKERNLQCKHLHDPLQIEEPSLRLGRSGGITGSSECEKSSEQPSDTQFGVKYNCATQVNCSGGNFTLGGGHITCTFGQQIANVNASKFTKDQNFSVDVKFHSEQGGKLDGQLASKIGSHFSQWRDVPCKVKKGVCDARSLGQPSNLDWGRQDEDQLENFPAKSFKRTIHMEGSLKEQESSNVSSGCSVPAVTQASVEVNYLDSSTVDATDNGYMDNLVGDEGSGIDKSWSSDALVSEQSAEFLGSTSETYMKKGYSRVLNDQPHRSLLDELKLLDSLTWKKGQDQNHNVLSLNCKANQSQKVKKCFKGRKRKRVELRMLEASMPRGKPSLSFNENCESTGLADFPSTLSKEMQMSFASSQQRFITRTHFVQPSIKHRFSTSVENSLINHHNGRQGRGSCESESNFDVEPYKFPEVSGRKKLRKNPLSDVIRQFQVQTPAQTEIENANLKSSCGRQATAYNNRPVVCGKYGEICSQNLAEEVPKPAKIVSLAKVLKTSKRCGVHKNDKPGPTRRKKRKKLRSGTSDGCFYDHFSSKADEALGSQNALVCDETNVDMSMEDLKSSNKPPVTCKVKGDIKDKHGDSVVSINAPMKLKDKEIQQCSIHELTAKETRVEKILEYAEDRRYGLCNTNSKKSAQEERSTSIWDSDAFCCVCQSSSNDEINCLLKCNRCLIRVHQACYGISSLPKGRWYCRPCRTNSKDIACVLCGYGGGAMTRALRSCTIVKSLLKVWNIEKGDMPRDATPPYGFGKDMDVFHSTQSGLADQKCALIHENTHTLATDLWKAEMSANHMQHAPCCNGNLKVHNSITAGVLDRTVKQWVHMVCGLWTPQTRCPNVDTMSAFDVSGVPRPRADVVCSICNRWGGSCIECRVVNCTVKFHPWCAHQKGLLQSETEGVDDEKVGFYGRCPLHAIDPICQSEHDSIESVMCYKEEKNLTCARTECYKGRIRDGFRHNHYDASKGKGGCLVPQEQLNAWIHINGQKFCSQGLSKFPASDVEYDCRKEYARYNQSKGWKHLVVYKSRIHALGLYTSRFISRGEMVVEYVGEIVGLRVADKRENEYQSGRKLQYKSACYFFRIDKEHIIDATRKGGIARFVNHSCLPNCVAKVITVRQEKKVLFFAERDIFPGEEITYDYHFNNEDEGKKIPCYCNSRNCRRYLN